MTEMRNYYTYGNTVRQVETMPVPSREERERQRREDELRKKRIAKRKKEIAIRRHRLGMIYLSIVVFLACGVLVGYVHLQTDNTARMKHVAELETQIANLKADNSATQSRIETTANLNVVRGIAMQELGMVYANSDQIVYYDMDTNDSMNQYQSIP